MRPLLALLLAAPAFAGCLEPAASLLAANRAPELSPDDLGIPADWAHRALPWGDGHDHWNRSHHRNLSTPNFDVVGWNPLVTAYHGRTSGSYTCAELAPRAGDRNVAYVTSFNTDVAFVAVDVTDPADPQKIGEFAMPAVRTYDLSVTPDGKYVVLGTSQLNRNDVQRDAPNASRSLSVPLPRAPVAGGDPCRAGLAHFRAAEAAPEEPLPYVAGLVLVDVQDPANPRVVDYVPQQLYGVHSVFVTEIDGRMLGLASNVNGLPNPGAPPLAVGSIHAVSYFTFFEVKDGKLEVLSTYRPPPKEPLRAPVRNGHLDGTIAVHPITNQTLAYLADWDGGVSILDLADPTRPALLGQWTPYRYAWDDPQSGKIHNAVPISVTWEGRHYTIAGQEHSAKPRDTPSGQIFILDTTDPANPTWVSSWTLPSDVQWHTRLLMSLHYYAVKDRTLFLTAYHAGLWAIDLSDVAQPRSAGVFFPENDPDPHPPKAYSYGSPSLMDVSVLPGGEILVFDVPSGAYTLRFDPTREVPPVAEWPLLEPDDA